MNKHRILLVDDDRDVLLGASKRLATAGFEVIVAYDGDEGVASAAAHRPDVIILDVRMPRKDGLTALAELQTRETTKNIPVVMLSASLGDQRAALEAGARFFLRKPYSGPMLINAVNKAIAEADTSTGGCASVRSTTLPATLTSSRSTQSVELSSVD